MSDIIFISRKHSSLFCLLHYLFGYAPKRVTTEYKTLIKSLYGGSHSYSCDLPCDLRAPDSFSIYWSFLIIDF